MKKPTKRLFFGVLGIVAVGVAIVVYMVVSPLTVEVVKPSEKVAIQVFGLGTVEARIISYVGFEVGAALVDLQVDHGDKVTEGDVIARLHDAEQKARVAKSSSGMISAEAAVKRTEASVDKAKAVLAQRNQRNERKQELLSNKTVSIEVAEEAQMEVEVAAAELKVAISENEVAKAAFKEASAQYEYERVLLDHHVLRAPYDAIVVDRHKELGSVLNPGEPLFTLVAPESVWVLAYVDEARAGDIRVGQAAEISLRSQPKRTLRGHVTRIGIESDRVSEERKVYIACDDCPEAFHLGEQAEVLITTSIVENKFLVPETVIERFNGRTGTVWTVEDGQFRRRDLSFGQRTLDARLEIIGGLPNGAQVVSNTPTGLRDGRKAKVAKGMSQ